MNKCLNCGKDVKNKYCNVSCQNEHQVPERMNKKHGKLKLFTVECEKCGNDYQVEEREKNFPKKEHYFCSRSCANSRIKSNETRKKTRLSLLHTIYTSNEITFNEMILNLTKCNGCMRNFVQNFSTQKYCSLECYNKSKNAGKKFKTYKETSSAITYIYALEYPKGNIRYIGKSDKPKGRLRRHITLSKNLKTHKDKWIQSLEEEPYLIIIEEVKNYEWQDKEKYWIKYYESNNLVNGTDGGEGSNGFKGHHHTKLAKEKISYFQLNKKIMN